MAFNLFGNAIGTAVSAATSAANAVRGSSSVLNRPNNSGGSSGTGGSSGSNSGGNKVTQTTYTDAYGRPQTGYIINGTTYSDPSGKNPVGIGSVVNTNGGTYIKTENGSMRYEDYLAQLQQPNIPQLDDLPFGDRYGFTYDMDEILNILNSATKGQYELKNQLMQQAENKFYEQLNTSQAETLGTLRKAQSDAVATGASKGLTAANELSMMLGLQQGTTSAATDIVNDKQNLATEESAAYAENAKTAMDSSNSIKQIIAQLDSQKYGYDIQQFIGQLDYNAAIANVLGNKYNADKTLEGVQYNADKNLEGTKYNADANAYNSGNRYYGSGSGGSGSGSGGSATGGNTTTTETGGKKTLDQLVSDNNNFYTPPNTNFSVQRDGNGTYSAVNPDGSVVTGMSADQMERAIANNNIEAGNYTYGITQTKNAIKNAASTLTVGNKTYGAPVNLSTAQLSAVQNGFTMPSLSEVNSDRARGEMLNNWKKTVQSAGYDIVQKGNRYTAVPKKPDYSVVDSLDFKNGTQVQLSGGINATWTYNMKSGIWQANNGRTMNIDEFARFINNAKDVSIKIS